MEVREVVSASFIKSWPITFCSPSIDYSVTTYLQNCADGTQRLIQGLLPAVRQERNKTGLPRAQMHLLPSPAAAPPTPEATPQEDRHGDPAPHTICLLNSSPPKVHRDKQMQLQIQSNSYLRFPGTRQFIVNSKAFSCHLLNWLFQSHLNCLHLKSNTVCSYIHKNNAKNLKLHTTYLDS